MSKSIKDTYVEKLAKMSRPERDGLFERILERIEEKETFWKVGEENIGKLIFTYASKYGELIDLKTPRGIEFPGFEDFGTMYHVEGWNIGYFFFKYLLFKEDKDYGENYYIKENLSIDHEDTWKYKDELVQAVKEVDDVLYRSGVDFASGIKGNNYYVYFATLNGDASKFYKDKGIFHKLFGKLVSKEFIKKRQAKFLKKEIWEVGRKHYKVINELFGKCDALKFIEPIKNIIEKYD